MFPKTQEVVDVVFRQVLANNVRGKLDNPSEAKIHAEVVGVLTILFGDFVERVEITHTSFKSYIEVHLNAEDPYIVWVEFDWDYGTTTKGFI